MLLLCSLRLALGTDETLERVVVAQEEGVRPRYKVGNLKGISDILDKFHRGDAVEVVTIELLTERWNRRLGEELWKNPATESLAIDDEKCQPILRPAKDMGDIRLHECDAKPAKEGNLGVDDGMLDDDLILMRMNRCDW